MGRPEQHDPQRTSLAFMSPMLEQAIKVHPAWAKAVIRNSLSGRQYLRDSLLDRMKEYSRRLLSDIAYRLAADEPIDKMKWLTSDTDLFTAVKVVLYMK
jgi:hypothetical protein